VSETVVNDCNGARLLVGAAVLVDEHPAVVVAISDPDGDVGDDGRTIGINPVVAVRFMEGDTDEYTTRWTAKGWWDEDAPYVCEELAVVLAPVVS
jgi:hypothetical protein